MVFPPTIIELRGGPRTTAQRYGKFAKLKRRQRYGNTTIVRQTGLGL
jgi:hypothetical protein